MCLICLNYVWRTVSIAIVNILTCTVILAVTVVYKCDIDDIMAEILETRQCWKYNADSELNWSLIYSNTENSCIFIFLQNMFPLGVYIWTVSHILTDVMLIAGAFYKSNAVILVYLSLDAAHVGVLSSFWSTAFLTEKLPRMILMIILFPLISLSLCSWMTIFGFYLKLEEKAWNRIKRKRKKEKLEKILTSEWIKSHSKEDLTDSMYNLCSGSIEEGNGKLPKQKNLEEILKQELAWTLEQIGEENEVGGTSSQEMASFSNEAFQRDEEIET